ncbi:MAG: TolC family protein [Gemmatimonadales bacterium]
MIRRAMAPALFALALGAAPLAAQRPVLDTLPQATLSLDDALRLALPASEAVSLARSAVRRAQGDVKKARSEFFPQITGTASYTRTLKSQFSRSAGGSGTTDTTQTTTTSCNRFRGDPSAPVGTRLDSLESAVGCLTSLNPFAAFGNLPFGQKNQYRLGLDGSQILYAGGRVRAQTRAAQAAERSAKIGLTAQEAQLTLDVTQAYYDAALADQLLLIARGTLQLADSTYQQTVLARKVGSQPEFDVLRAQVSRDNARTAAIQRESDREIAFLRLKQLLNLPLAGPLTLTTPVVDSLLPVVPALDSLVSRQLDTVVDERAPVRQAQASVDEQEQRYRVAKAERYPAVTLSSSFARLGYPSDLLPSWSDFVSDWTVGLTVKVPLFTGGRIGGSVQSAGTNAEDARIRLRQARERAAVDTRSALERLRAAGAAWEASQGTVAQAEKAYAIAEIRYRNGISTQTELADSRILLEQARANRATAGRDLQTARVRVALLPELPLAQ